MTYPLRIEPEGINQYFMIREGFSIMSLLKNPMLIMMGVTLAFTFLIPKMMASIDPEALAEMQGKDKKENLEPPPKWTAPQLTFKE